MVTRQKIVIISLACAINMEEYFCDVFGKELLHAKILVADLKLGF